MMQIITLNDVWPIIAGLCAFCIILAASELFRLRGIAKKREDVIAYGEETSRGP